MKQWFLKTFRKKVVIQCNILTEDGRVHVRYAIPEGKCVKVKGYGEFNLQKDARYYDGSIPAYFFNYMNADPIKLETGKVSAMSPEKYEIAKSDAQAKNFMKHAKKQDGISSDTIVLAIVMLILVGGVYYMLSEQINVIIEMLKGLGITP